jgi:hypothetical protein
MYSKNNF